jgi:glyoxylase-like metal-dependent hydrolase (beta-lactamase superfamily II)
MRNHNSAWKFNGLKLLTVAGLGAAILLAGAQPVQAFGHDKLRDTLNRLTQPPPSSQPAPQPTQQPAPAPEAKPVAKQAPPPPPRRRAPKRSITQIAGDVYQFKNNFHNSVFMVTPSGVIFVDPINKDASTWLKAELRRRFNRSVRYVIYSHDRADHISGGEVFADTAIFIAHAAAKRDIIDENRPTPVPDITFTDNMTVELGGKMAVLSFVGRNHSDNSTIVAFPAERVLHVVDFIPVQSIAFRDLPDIYLDDWFTSLKKVEAMDFDILSPGHGRLGNKEDVRAFRGYLQSLRDQVTRLARAGRSAGEVVAAVTMDKYKSWGGYGRFIKHNVRGMYNLVQLNRRGNR